MDKLPRWLLFNVCIALLPIGLNYFLATMINEPGSQGLFSSVSRNGELFIISTAILGESVGDLVVSENTKYTSVVVGGVSVLLLISTTFLFASVSTSDFIRQGVDAGVISRTSLHFFFASFVISACCKLMAHEDENSSS